VHATPNCCPNASIETVEILFFKRRLDAGDDIALPVEASLRLATEI
jgi:hypothetical protein